jgi:hypothetical protein
MWHTKGLIVHAPRFLLPVDPRHQPPQRTETSDSHGIWKLGLCLSEQESPGQAEIDVQKTVRALAKRMMSAVPKRGLFENLQCLGMDSTGVPLGRTLSQCRYAINSVRSTAWELR